MQGISSICKTFTLVYDHEASVINTGLPVDEYALEVYLTDTPAHSTSDPVKVKADGNCLAYAGVKQNNDLRIINGAYFLTYFE